MVFTPANKVSFDPRPQMAALFVTGFYSDLHYFSKDKAKLTAVFAPAFQLPTFFLALGADNQVLAMVGCPDGLPALQLDQRVFISVLGAIRGRFAYLMLKKFLIDHDYPFAIEPGMGSIEYVVSDVAVRGLGITGRLIEYVMRQRGYNSYVLEVASTNDRAVRLYERLGFTELMRVPAPKRSSVGDYIYLRKQC